MQEHEDEDQADDRRRGWRVCETPGERRQQQEEGEEVGEGRVRSMPGVLGLCSATVTRVRSVHGRSRKS